MSTTAEAVPAKQASGRAPLPLDLLVFNLRTDVDHTALGFTTSWVNALARRVGHVTVITMYAGEIATEPNVVVHSLGKERGASEPRRVLEFYRLVRTVLAERRIDACFSHMNPKFSVMFAPVAKARGIPQLLWFAHGSTAPALRAAHRLVDRCVTSTPSGFRLRSDKLHVIGQGIDTSLFVPPRDVGLDYARSAVSIGKISPVKRVDEMIDATALVRDGGLDFRLELVGEPLHQGDGEYLDELRSRARSLGVGDAVTFAGRVPFPEIPSRYHHGALFLNLSTNRSLDKAILESMASGCVPVSRNESFACLAADAGFSELVPGPGPEGVAERILALAELAPGDRTELARRLRALVEAEHSLDSLADRIVGHLAELAASRKIGSD